MSENKELEISYSLVIQLLLLFIIVMIAIGFFSVGYYMGYGKSSEVHNKYYEDLMNESQCIRLPTTYEPSKFNIPMPSLEPTPKQPN